MVKTLLVLVFLITSCQSPRKTGDSGFSQPNFKNSGGLFAPPVPSYSQHPKFKWPIKNARFIRGFNADPENRHLGLDVAAAKGTKIYASIKGVIIYAGNSFTGYGNVVVIGHENNEYATIYGHLDKILVKQGMLVKSTTVIGLMGNTGRSTGTHLHFEIRHKDGPLDPIDLLGK